MRATCVTPQAKLQEKMETTTFDAAGSHTRERKLIHHQTHLILHIIYIRQRQRHCRMEQTDKFKYRCFPLRALVSGEVSPGYPTLATRIGERFPHRLQAERIQSPFDEETMLAPNFPPSNP
ncbi:hypothetical protein R1flu_015315 [Riccia fluitans]|uniref:Uncharacterized protein n=1 Tax=Riccia fluitans TaxID=41844 RepID=A0ABD1YJN9_9MARC